MALKYQALNGTVISNITTISGIDLAKRGTPQLLGGLPTVEGHVFPFCGMTNAASGSTTSLNPSTTMTFSTPPYGIKRVDINGVSYYGFVNSNYYFFSYEDGATNSYMLKGKFIIVKATNNSGIITEELPVNVNVSSGAAYNKGLVLNVAKQTNDVILSITFEPTT